MKGKRRAEDQNQSFEEYRRIRHDGFPQPACLATTNPRRDARRLAEKTR